MIRGLLASLAIAACLSTPAVAAPAKAELLQTAASGAAACAEAMPDRRATAAALTANGFRLAETDGVIKAYTAHGHRVFVGITTTANSNRMDACIVLASKMTLAEAEALMQPWLRAAGAVPLPPGGRFEKAWSGFFKGTPVELLIEENADLGIVRGAAIVARARAQ